MDENILEVHKSEYHYWPRCECSACAAERKRRNHSTQSATTPIRSVPFHVAYAMGYVSRRSPCGSLARELMQERGDG